MYKTTEFIALSGMPRTGSTLLTSILSQNPEIHAEGLSPVMRIMKNSHDSLKYELPHIKAGKKEQDFAYTIRNMYKNYYADVNGKYIFDKHRSWVIPIHEDLIKQYIRHDPKLIIQMRDFDEIQESLKRLPGAKKELEMVGNITREWYDKLVDLRKQNLPSHLWIDYNDLVEDTPKIIKSIYDFCEIPFFKGHYYENISNPHLIDDEVYKIKGLHDVRSSIGFREK